MSDNKYLNKKTKRDENKYKYGKDIKDYIDKEKENKKDEKIIETIKYNNFILGTIKVSKNSLKQRIINSYENAIEEYYNFDGEENEKEIKACEIFINDKKINFCYFYEFPNKGIYNIKYVFKKFLNITNYMFFDCESLISLNLSNFNTQNVTNMNYMFYNCNSLISLYLSNFNTQNVTNMNYMFYNCISLICLNFN